MASPFCFSPLAHRHIRLLKVTRHSNIVDRIQFEFHTVPLDNLPFSYTALSYLWGSAVKTGRVWRGDDDEYIEVTTSAMSILKAIAAGADPPFIWIDGLCIDQANKIEKGVQVHMMRDIYAKAKTVVAWLEYSAELDGVTAFIDTLHGATTDLYRQKQPVTLKSLSLSPGCQDPSSWRKLAKFLADPWFGRVWVIQEMVVPDKVNLIYGPEMIPWKALADVISIIQGNGLSRLLIELVDGEEMNPPSGVESMVRTYAIRTLYQTNQPRTLSFLLLNCWKCGATDGRDKVYALLGMASDMDDVEFSPDYTTPEYIIFETLAAKLLTRDANSTRLLHAAGIGLSRNNNVLPSWVPDWTAPFPNTIFGDILTAGYRSSGDATTTTSPRGISYNQQRHTIRLSGHLIDCINWVADPLPPAHWYSTRTGLQQKAAAELAWISHIRALYPQNRYPDSSYDFFPYVLSRSLIANMVSPGVVAPPEYTDYFDQFIKYKTWTANTTAQEWDAEKWDESSAKATEVHAASRYATAMSVCQSRRFFVSEKRYCGLGNPGILVGDRVCIFRGFITPFIVRRRNDGTYSLAGECYIYGLMNGEGLGLTLEEDIILS